MKYALMLPEYNVKKAEKELQDFKDNKINLLTNKEARKKKEKKCDLMQNFPWLNKINRSNS